MTLAQDRPADAAPASRPRRPLRPHTHVRPPSAPSSDADRPRIADGVQLLGEYAGTGYKEPQYLARRGGGKLVQLSRLLHDVAERCDGRATYDEIAEGVTAAYGRQVSADNVRTLVEDKLRPLGVLAAADGTSPPVEDTDPLFGLKLRTQVLPPHAVRAVARAATPLFWPPVVAAVLLGLAAVDVWLFFVHGVGQGIRSTVEQPLVFLLVGAVIVVSAALHELGHAAACRYGGAQPGGMGAGIYVVWPAFYTDVTEAYALDRRGRLRTDLGGVHVNALIVCVVAGLYAVTRYEPLVLLCFLLQIQVLQQMLPFLRLDGYYVLSDLVGVPDLFRRIGPVLRSSLPFRRREEEVDQLKPWVRRVVAGWVFVLVPLLAVNLGYFVLSAPRIAATSWDSASRYYGQLTTAGGAEAVVAGLQLLLLLLPSVGITYTVLRMARRGLVGAWRWSAGSAARRSLVLTGLGLLLFGLAVAWYPDGRLAPYREGEPGTVQQGVADLRSAGSGAPLLRSPEQAQEPLEPVQEGTSAVQGASGDRTASDGAGPVADPEPAASPSATPVPTQSAGPTSSPSSVRSTEPAPSASASATSSPSTSTSASRSPSPTSSPTGTSTSTSTTPSPSA